MWTATSSGRSTAAPNAPTSTHTSEAGKFAPAIAARDSSGPHQGRRERGAPHPVTSGRTGIARRPIKKWPPVRDHLDREALVTRQHGDAACRLCPFPREPRAGDAGARAGPAAEIEALCQRSRLVVSAARREDRVPSEGEVRLLRKEHHHSLRILCGFYRSRAATTRETTGPESPVSSPLVDVRGELSPACSGMAFKRSRVRLPSAPLFHSRT